MNQLKKKKPVKYLAPKLVEMKKKSMKNLNEIILEREF